MSARWLLASSVLSLAACGESGQNGRDVRLDFGPPSGGSGGSGGSVSGGTGGSAFGPPVVAQLSPTGGDYGTTVTINGTGLGSAARSATLVLDGDPAQLVTPESPEVLSWSEESIQFRYPFPNAGAVVIQTAVGATVAGDFTPSWIPGPSADLGAGSSIIASLAPAPGRIMAAFSGTPIQIYDFDQGEVALSRIAADTIVPSSFRLYRTSDGDIQAFAISNEIPPQVVNFVRSGTSWTATPTGVTVSSEFRVAGGVDGGVVWFLLTDGWHRARSLPDGWSIDKGPITPPAHSGVVDYGADATGGLYVGFNVDTGTLLDDVETPFLQRLAPDETAFGGETQAGTATDDYLTDLSIIDRGSGVVVYYCGSDSDPFGVSGTGYACFFSGYPPGGTFSTLPYGMSKPAFGVTSSVVAAGYCDGDSLRVTSDVAGDPGPVVVWPCSGIDALEFDTAGVPQLLVRSGSSLYAPKPVLTP